MSNDVSDDGEDYADYEESEGSRGSKKDEKGRPEPQPQVSAIPEATISKEAFDAARQGFVARQTGPQLPAGPVNLDRIGKHIFRLSTIYYASDKQLYDNTELFLDYYDGTFHIKDFEKQCSLSQKKPELIKTYCEQHEKERLKRLNKDKKKDALEPVEGAMKEEPLDHYDSRRDLNSDYPHHRFKEALEDSNPLNSVEFYQQLFTSFCNQLDQSTPQSRLVERLDLETEDRRDHPTHRDRIRPARKSSMAGHTSQHYGTFSFNMGDSARSPRSPAPYESAYSFAGGAAPTHGLGDSMYRAQRGSFHSRDSGEKPTIGGSTGILHEQVESRKQQTHREVAIAKDFLRLLHGLEQTGRIKLGSASALDRSQALSTNPLFRYHSVVGGDDHLSKDPLAKRHEKEVFLDYERELELGAVKQLKVGGLGQNHYSNQDLVYSSWYDQVAARVPGDTETSGPGLEDKRSLLVDLNDRSVFYSKLANMLNDKDPVEDPAAPVPDLMHNTYHFNDKTKEKQFNELKKTVRIMIANGTDPNEANELIRAFLKGKHGGSYIATSQAEGNPVGAAVVRAQPFGGKTTQNRMIANYYHSVQGITHLHS